MKKIIIKKPTIIKIYLTKNQTIKFDVFAFFEDLDSLGITDLPQQIQSARDSITENTDLHHHTSYQKDLYLMKLLRDAFKGVREEVVLS